LQRSGSNTVPIEDIISRNLHLTRFSDYQVQLNHFHEIFLNHIDRVRKYSQYELAQPNILVATSNQFVIQLKELWNKFKIHECRLDVAHFYILFRKKLALHESQTLKKIRASEEILQGLLMRIHFVSEQIFHRISAINENIPYKIKNVPCTSI
jgi:hypothetical protein